MLFVFIAALVVIFLVSERFGADSRPGIRERAETWIGAPRQRGP